MNLRRLCTLTSARLNESCLLRGRAYKEFTSKATQSPSDMSRRLTNNKTKKNVLLNMFFFSYSDLLVFGEWKYNIKGHVFLKLFVKSQLNGWKNSVNRKFKSCKIINFDRILKMKSFLLSGCSNVPIDLPSSICKNNIFWHYNGLRTFVQYLLRFVW